MNYEIKQSYLIGGNYLSIDDMNGHQFEQMCAELLAFYGFKKVHLLNGINQYGLDIIAKKDNLTYGFQCKKKSGSFPVELAILKRTLSGKEFYQCDYIVVITNGIFEEPVIEFADQNGIQLWNREHLFSFVKHMEEVRVNEALAADGNAKQLSHVVEDNAIDIDSMDGHQFEGFCAKLLEKNHYDNVHLTKGSGDQGIDIIAYKKGIKFGIQCKCYSSAVGNKAVQEAFSGKTYYQCHVGVVITNNYFTSAAKDLAKRNSIILWDRDKLFSLVNVLDCTDF